MATSDNPQIEDIRLRVSRAYDALNQLLDGPVANIDTARVYQSPGSDEWTIMENLAHIVEFMPYWGNEAAKLVAHPGQNFGRTQLDEARLQAISEHKSDSMAQIRAALPESYKRLDQILATLKDSDLELTGIHSKFGERKLRFFLEDFVVKHLEDHVEQIKSCL